MKVLSLIIVVIGYAAALGSGPYLPSGWKPSGPAFYLPTEIEKTSPIPLKEFPVQEEASGSDFLREYGPPKVEEISQDITLQKLPEEVTDQAFVVIEAKFNQEEEIKDEVKATETSIEESEETIPDEASTTESQIVVEEKITISGVAQGRSVDIEASDVEETETTEKSSETVQETENANSNIVTVEDTVAEIKSSDDSVNNIAEALTNLENEIKAQQVQTISEVIEEKTVQQDSKSGSEQVPEGFLEYGPPGFKEYGPPKQDQFLRSNGEEVSPLGADTNETRRRRFSPKFKTLQKTKPHRRS